MNNALSCQSFSITNQYKFASTNQLVRSENEGRFVVFTIFYDSIRLYNYFWSCLMYNKNRTVHGGTPPPLFHLPGRSEKSPANALDVFTARLEVEYLRPPASLVCSV